MPLAGNPLHRAGNERRDPRWNSAALAGPGTRFLPVHRLDVPVTPAGPGHGNRAQRLAWAPRGDWLQRAGESVLLGLDGGEARFAVDVSCVPDPVTASFGAGVGVEFQGLRTAAPNLSPGDAAIAAQARSLLGWHERHPFCAACGAATRIRNAGASRMCPECGSEHFPRTDPVVIAVVSRGGRALLGRSGRFPADLYSALAGFMEPGESVEEAVRREVEEEAGVRVGAVRYVFSQPWPFPASLMLGCLAEGLNDEIAIDPEEIEDARWFSRAELAEALAGRSDILTVPPPLAIAHHLIRAWLAA